MSDTKIIDKIRKLLRLAQDGGAAEGEVENALKFAKKMMDEHGLAEDQILLTETEDRSTARLVEIDVLDLAVAFYPWDRTLASGVASLCKVGAVFKQKNVMNLQKHRYIVHEVLVYYGLPHDVAFAKDLYLELRVTMKTMARLRTGEDRSAARDYQKGFSIRMRQRCVDLERDSTPQVHALVLRKDVLLQRYAAENFGPLRSIKSRTTVKHGSAFSSGKSDADNVELRKARKSSSRDLTGSGNYIGDGR